MEKKKWTYEICYEEAKKYSSATEFLRASHGAYNSAWRNKWLKDYTWFMSKSESMSKARTVWTYEACYEEARKYKTRAEIKRNSQGAYDAMLRNKWLDDYTWLEPSKSAEKWNKETCYTEAKKYKSRGEFFTKSNGAYNKARRNGWLVDYSWLKRQSHNKEDFYIYVYVDEAKKIVYVGLSWRKRRHSEHKRKGDNVYKYFNGKVPDMRIVMTDLSAEDAQYYEDWYKKAYAAQGYIVLNKAKTGVGSSSLGSSIIKWDYDTCFKAAQGYTCKSKFAKECDGAYRIAKREGWIKDYIWFEELKKPCGYWTYERCYEEAKKFSSRKELGDNNETVYKIVLGNGWINDYTWFKPVTSKPRGYWTYERCYEEALKYDRIIDFEKANHPAYTACWRNGWIRDFFQKAA